MSGRLRSRRAAVAALLLLLCLASWRSFGRSFGLLGPTRPVPDVADLRYGPHERNVLDVWKAKPQAGRTGPTPLLVYFHGGGFRGGDKVSVPAWLIIKCLDAGISVASANYRLSQTTAFPGPMLDGARAIQFVRFKAAELGIDPDRIAASGNSAGAGIALWVGFHDDLADARSDDAIARASSRVCCLAVDGAQTSYDPRFIKSLIGGRAHEHAALSVVLRPQVRRRGGFAASPATVRTGFAHQLRHIGRPACHHVLRRARCAAAKRCEAGAGDSSSALWLGTSIEARSARHRVHCSALWRFSQGG